MPINAVRHRVYPRRSPLNTFSRGRRITIRVEESIEARECEEEDPGKGYWKGQGEGEGKE
ncbi:hypothetical protein PM082_023225 [Marasmius tenuissimus]|nr:hypothetical protein PM082_023225 [Marasmius tenuissimus]